MVYFVIGGHYKSGNTSIIITSLGTDYLTYKRERGTKEYRAHVRWARLKSLDHPVQYIRLDGRLIFALNIRD